jgi:hypothetical protein
MSDLSVAIDEAIRKRFIKKSFVDERPDVLGVHEGYTVHSIHPLSTKKGRIARDKNKLGCTSKKVNNWDGLTWPRSKEPHEHRALSAAEADINHLYKKISKEPDYAY